MRKAIVTISSLIAILFTTTVSFAAHPCVNLTVKYAKNWTGEMDTIYNSPTCARQNLNILTRGKDEQKTYKIAPKTRILIWKKDKSGRQRVLDIDMPTKNHQIRCDGTGKDYFCNI